MNASVNILRLPEGGILLIKDLEKNKPFKS